MSTLVITGATATVEVGGGIDLDLTRGQVEVEFDEGWTPYCTVTIVAALPAAADLAQIDPRAGLRITMTRSQGVDGGTPQTDPFDLYLVDRDADRKADTLRLEAVSDDFRLTIRDLVDTEPDESARALQASLRSIINNRLAGIGGALDASPSTDFDLTRAIRVGNYVRNPKAKIFGSTHDWSASAGTLSRQTSGGPAGATTFMRITGAATNPRLQYGSTISDQLTHPEGEPIIASAWVRCSTAKTVTIHYLSYLSGVLTRDVSAAFAIPANTWTRISVTMPLIINLTVSGPVTQPNGTRGYLYFETSSIAAGVTLDATGLRVSPATGHQDTDYFDPDTATTAYYTFHPVSIGGWIDGFSTSYRYPQPAYDRPVDALDQQPGQSDWDFLTGLVAIPGYRLFCDENAVWRLVDPAAWPASPDHFDLETTTAVNYTDRIYLDGADSADEAVVTYEEPATVTYDASATGTRAKTLRGNLRLHRPYAGPGGAAAIAARASGRYLEANFEGLADLDIRPSATCAFQESGVDILTGVVRKVSWDSSTGLTVVTPRDLVAP